MRPGRSVAMSFFVVATLAAFWRPHGAAAHSFYDTECCAGIDCQPVPEGEITATKEGWLVRTTGEIIKYNTWPVKHSPDGRFHRCAGLGNFGPKGRTQCLYVPDFGE